MRVRRLPVLAAAIATIALAWPANAPADHVSVDGRLTAQVERAGTNIWRVKLDFVIFCGGGGPSGASYRGDLYLVDLDTGDSIYLGGVAGQSGTVTQLIHSKARWQRLSGLLKVNCFDNSSLHGSDRLEIGGGFALIPPRQGGAGGGGGGEGGGGGANGADPTEPLRTGGCKELLIGTEKADDLLGSTTGDIVFGLGKGDKIRGGAAHDCLLGEAGPDELRGEDGWDRLTGGAGRDRLYGGEGLNAYDAGRGRDFIDSANGRREVVRCGPGRDHLKADPSDDLFGCEVISRVKKAVSR